MSSTVGIAEIPTVWIIRENSLLFQQIIGWRQLVFFGLCPPMPYLWVVSPKKIAKAG